MKILHTADWHLNDKHYGQDRTPHLRKRVEELADICESNAVDLLLIAGDLFSELATATEVVNSFRHLRRTFTTFFARGGIILGVTGNHDQDGRVRPFIELARAGMDLAEPPKKRGDYFIPGKMYLLDTSFIGRVHSPQEKFDVQCVLLPFPNNSRVLTGDEKATTAGELHRLNQVHVGQWIRTLPEVPGYDPSLRTIFIAHLQVSGADIGRGLYHPTEEHDIILDWAVMPVSFDYVALGHIHKPQCLHDLPHVRYAGSLDRMNLGEKDEDKGVVLLDLGPEGLRGDPIFTPTQSTPVLNVTITDPNISVAEIQVQVPDAERSLVRVEVVPDATVNASEQVAQLIREALPDVKRIFWQFPELTEDPTARVIECGNNVRTTVLGYLEKNLTPDDPQREDLLALAARFLDEGEIR